MESELSKLKSILIASNYSITAPRLAVFTALYQADKPLRPAKIAKLCSHINRSSVYRTLDIFSSLHITNTVLRGWTPTVELSDKFKPHHHRIICSQCGANTSIESDALEATLNQIARAKGYKLSNHTVELAGLCPKCQPKVPKVRKQA